MKKLIGISLFVLFIGFSSTVSAQSTTKKVETDVKKGAKKVGNKTAEVASKGKARITDERYKNKVGPNGETIYIDKHSKYYWVDKKGHKQYVTESDLRDKTSSDQ